MKKYFLTILILVFIAINFIPNISFAQQDEGLIFSNPVPGLGKDPKIITGIVISRALGIIGVIAILLFLYAGVIWMTAAGDSTKIKKSQQIMFWAAIGLLIILGSYALLDFVFKVI